MLILKESVLGRILEKHDQHEEIKAAILIAFSV